MIPGNDRTAGPSGDRGKAISLATGGFSSASDWANGSAGSTSWPVIGTSRSSQRTPLTLNFVFSICSYFQAGRRGFESRLPLHRIN